MSVDPLALEHVMADGWRAVEEDRLGGWLLRASSGFTARGNSVLTAGSPGMPLSEAVAVVKDWYAARALPARFALLTDASGTPTDPLLWETLTTLGYAADQPTLAMTASASELPALTESSPPVTADARLTPPWLEAFAAYRSIVPGVAEQILTGSMSQLFLAVPAGPDASDRPGVPLDAIVRVSLYPGWAGLHAMWVARRRRRQGLATALVAAVAQLCREHGIPDVYLLVERANSAARAAFGGMGFRDHHGHVYLDRRPLSAPASLQPSR